MFLSVFDIFKIGIGPSSSHTMGPMTAASYFLSTLRKQLQIQTDTDALLRLKCSLHGSLAFTGKGHSTDRAVILGLLGLEPATMSPDDAEGLVAEVYEQKVLQPAGLPKFKFDPDTDLVFDYGPALPGHANGLIFSVFHLDGTLCFEETYYSIGGGFVVTAKDLDEKQTDQYEGKNNTLENTFPFPFRSALEMLQMGKDTGKSIAEMKYANELSSLSSKELEQELDHIWSVMDDCIDRGLSQDGELPGGLHVKRRAKAIKEQLDHEKQRNNTQPHVVNEWLSVYAMAVNEENAAGGRIVTSPTNGAAGVVPAVIRYYRDHCIGAEHDGIRTFLLTAAAIGGLIKHNASISGAEMGCQGEVGSASAMAAAGLCAALGGNNEQIENAAEIALEHHLGMTCDPVKGLVQVPCIERNGLGAIKAVSAASLALRGDGQHVMPLDNCIETMRQTGVDMNERYKETSTGGLAVNLPEC